ncbi:hypothetical protein KP509_32G061300 [Ceratopteris richardii]|uniref:Uncharacterized protein n=1 Tax=Ceratopteris richardii TaxID=49495 RepID=A0A8T2QTV4_CERRI|nr:hypothetical protein KP509_32G061300 [Ceratopteris richardii]
MFLSISGSPGVIEHIPSHMWLIFALVNEYGTSQRKKFDAECFFHIDLRCAYHLREREGGGFFLFESVKRKGKESSIHHLSGDSCVCVCEIERDSCLRVSTGKGKGHQ